MARKRLNKRVVLIGAAVVVVFATAAAVFFFLGGAGLRAPERSQLIAGGDAALKAGDYETAQLRYEDAFAASKSADEKVDLLFKSSDVYRAMGDWRRAIGCWEQVITIDPTNLTARFGQLKYGYILADSLSEFGQDVEAYWKQVANQATELIGLAQNAGVLAEDKDRWEPDFGADEQPGWDNGIGSLGAFLYFLKGRAAFELARMGSATSPEESLEDAKSALEASKELEPGNPAIYRYLAGVYLEEGNLAQSRNDAQSRQTALDEAETVLAEGVAAAEDEPDAHVNVLVRKLTLAQEGPIAEVRRKMKALEPEYRALVEKFPNRPEAFAAQAEFYSYYSTCLNLHDERGKLDDAIAAAEKAATVDPARARYARFIAMLYYRKSSLYGDKAALREAIEVADDALSQPQMQATTGPRHYAVSAERSSLYSLLATCCVEDVLTLPPDANERAALLDKVADAIGGIQQIQGSQDNPQITKWQGMLDLAQGKRGQAVRELYDAYEQIKTASGAGEMDSLLAYTLGKIYIGTNEVGAAIEFLEAALNSGVATTQPEAMLDYAKVLLQAGLYDAALNTINNYDERFGVNPSSIQLRIRTLLGNGHLAEAQKQIASLAASDPNTLRLQLTLLGAEASQLQEAIGRTESDAAAAPQSVGGMKAELVTLLEQQARTATQLWQQSVDISDESHLAQLCEALIDCSELDTAGEMVTVFASALPNSVAALFYQQLLSEPDPNACSPERLQEIRHEAIERVSDPATRSLALGAYYQDQDQLDQAAAQWRKVMNATGSSSKSGQSVPTDRTKLSPRQAAAGRLFDLACYREDWPGAEQIVEVAKADDLDGCQGHLFAGRLAFAQDRKEDALTELDECLRLRPVFSYGYMLRGNIRAAMGKERAAIADIQQALSLNPIDPVVAKSLASILLTRNRRLGDNVSRTQRAELQRALEHAMQLNPRDTQVLMAYADLIGSTDPLKALAIRQTIQANAPNLGNAVMLGRLATNAALNETDKDKRESFFAIAADAFEQARRTAPTNAAVLDSYAEYYRARGEDEKARELLVESQDSRLLWRHYYRIGRYDEARKVLEQTLDEQGAQPDTLKGLIGVAEATADKDALQNYSEQLLSIEDTAGNRLAQIHAYLDVGLVHEAGLKLASFEDRYPDNPNAGLLEALLAKRRGQVERALKLANRNLQKDQQDPAAWRLRGEICLTAGALDQAIASLQKSLSLEKAPSTAVGLARAYVWAGRDNEAIAQLKTVLESPAAPAEARTLLESTYRWLGRDDLLAEFYADTLDDMPDNVGWLIQAGAFALKQGSHDRAVERYEKAYHLRQAQLTASTQDERDVQMAASLDGYLHALVLQGQAAPQSLNTVLQVGARYTETPYAALVLSRMAEAAKIQGDSDSAQQYARRAVDAVTGDDTLALEILARVSETVAADNVARYCQEKLAEQPEAPAVNLLVMDLALSRTDYRGAVEAIDRFIDSGESQGARAISYQIKKADILTQAYHATSDKQYLRQAIDAYKSLAAQMPTNTSVLNNLAFVLAQEGTELSRALELAGKVLETDPDNAAYLDTYAYVLHCNGKDAEAVEPALAAIEQYEVAGTSSTAAYEHLGSIRESLGDRSSALAAYRWAGQIADDDAVRDRIVTAMERLQ